MLLFFGQDKEYGGPGIISTGGRVIRVSISFKVRVR